MHAEGLWILVMNTTRAQVLRSLTDSGETRQRRLVMRADRRRMSTLIEAQEVILPGRLAGQRLRRAMWRTALEADHLAFVRQVVSLLETHRIAGDFGQLAVFAAPSVLSRLYGLMPRHLRALVVAEIAESVIDFPFSVMRQRIAARLGARGFGNVDDSGGT